MTTESFPDEVERELATAAALMTSPSPGECLLCFVARMLDEFGCDSTLRWARRFRDLRAPRATALEDRLARVGGFCDCEIVLNGYTPTGVWRSAACARVAGSSTQPCALWGRQRRG